MKVLTLAILWIVGFSGYSQDLAPAKILVKDFDDQPISGAQIWFMDTAKDTMITGVSGADGRFSIQLPAGKYNIRLKSVGKTKDYSVIEIPELGPREVYNDVNIIIQYEEESSFTLSNLHFESNKADIQPQSLQELDELVKYLQLKKDLNVEIAGHTDSEGAADDNLVLSQKRSESVKAYLISKGISADRIIAKGYGETKPIATNDNANGRALNRRTEVFFIKNE